MRLFVNAAGANQGGRERALMRATPSAERAERPLLCGELCFGSGERHEVLTRAIRRSVETAETIALRKPSRTL